MGEVWKARDTRLGRIVALKCLPTEKVADVSRRQRFLQEAQAASALNHPNIVTIHDWIEHDSDYVLVMEYVPGKTLDRVIGLRGLPLRDALAYAIQIAAAVSAAHAAGIVHRDIKPSNIIIGDQGAVKVLDFGLAKLDEHAELRVSDATVTVRATTEEGMVAGSPPYMSPEQAEGKKLDARSDIFSFGAVLYGSVGDSLGREWRFVRLDLETGTYTEVGRTATSGLVRVGTDRALLVLPRRRQSDNGTGLEDRHQPRTLPLVR